MKLLTLIVHTHVQQELTTLLRGMEQVTGFTYSHVEGHGIEVENDAYLSARDNVVGTVPRIRLDILLQGKDVDVVLATLRDKTHNIAGQGIFWVVGVEQGGHLL